MKRQTSSSLGTDLSLFARGMMAKWFAYLGLIPAIYDLAATYLPKRWSVYRFEEWFLYSVPAISLLYAAFCVWREQRGEVDRLSAELAALRSEEPGFEVAYVGWGLSTELRDLREALPKRLGFARAELERRRGRSTTEPYFSTLGSDSASWSLYVERLERFEKQLGRHDNIAPRCSHVTFYVKNIGTKYDEKIHIRLWHERSDVSFLQPRGLQLEVPDPPNDRMTLQNLNAPSHEPPFRKVIAVEESSIEVEFRALRAREDGDVLWDGVYILGEGVLDVFAEISSRNTRHPIKTSVQLHLSALAAAEKPQK